MATGQPAVFGASDRLAGDPAGRQRHDKYLRDGALDCGARFRLELESEFAVDDLFECDVCIRHPRPDLYEGAMTHGQLPHALGNKIHQQSGIRNDFGRFLKKLARHNRLTRARQNADGTGRRKLWREREFVK